MSPCGDTSAQLQHRPDAKPRLSFSPPTACGDCASSRKHLQCETAIWQRDAASWALVGWPGWRSLAQRPCQAWDEALAARQRPFITIVLNLNSLSHSSHHSSWLLLVQTLQSRRLYSGAGGPPGFLHGEVRLSKHCRYYHCLCLPY